MYGPMPPERCMYIYVLYCMLDAMYRLCAVQALLLLLLLLLLIHNAERHASKLTGSHVANDGIFWRYAALWIFFYKAVAFWIVDLVSDYLRFLHS